MKFALSALIAFSISASIVHGGTILRDQSIDFADADFADSKTASKEIVINAKDSSSDTNVFDFKNMSLGDDGRLGTLYGDQPVEYYVTYKVTVPSGKVITKFTFALNNLTLSGKIGGGNSVSYQYSTDGQTFHDFFTRDNRADTGDGKPDGWKELLNQTCDATLSAPADTLYVRIYQNGNGSPNYFAIWSAPGGGSDANSYISVTVQAASGAGTKSPK